MNPWVKYNLLKLGKVVPYPIPELSIVGVDTAFYRLVSRHSYPFGKIKKRLPTTIVGKSAKTRRLEKEQEGDGTRSEQSALCLRWS